MHKKHITSFLIAGLILLFFSCQEPKKEAQASIAKEFHKPWESMPDLFEAVQFGHLFPDSKTFADYTPKSDPRELNDLFLSEKEKAEFSLEGFVSEYFDAPGETETMPSQAGTLERILDEKWDYLTRDTESQPDFTTLIPLPTKYVVPGGRFREVYYWDSYFTMIGLGVSGRTDLIEAMLDNFAFLIDTVGFVPNGNRTYYLGRSQPPFFSSMVNLYIQLTSKEAGIKYLPAIQKEYDFWMSGLEDLTEEKPAIRRLVRLPDGTVLNRYWDDLDFPRPESHREDVELAESLEGESKKELYRNLRAGAESGWDYSTRWFENKESFATIRTTEILPVDLNCLLFAMEIALANFYDAQSDSKAQQYSAAAEVRALAINNYLWNNEKSAYTDYIWTEQRAADQLTLAGCYPLYFRVATDQKAKDQARVIEEHFLKPGGLVTTTIESGQQWDAPNGWAPLQWVGVKGLEHYGYEALADDISERWVRVNRKVFRNTGKMMEKYNVMDTTLLAGGGEYPAQDGFGWTNGVFLGLVSDSASY